VRDHEPDEHAHTSVARVSLRVVVGGRRAVGIRALAVLGMLASIEFLGCGAAVFECEGADDCVGGRAEGMCQGDGWCSFADGTCSSGQRYGERAPSGIAGACVDPELDASTGIAGTETDPSTTATTANSSTSTSATTTTTDATSTTTDPTTSMTMPDTMPSSPTSDSASDSMGTPVCGDGVLDPDDPDGEQCDGSDFGGLDCSDFGFDGGMLVCDDACSISSAGCTNCEMGCPTDCTSPDDCADDEWCVVPADGMLGACWPQCPDLDACALILVGGACFNLRGGSACLLPCEGNGRQCPDGLTCSLLQDKRQLACL